MNISIFIRYIGGFILILCLFGCGSSPTQSAPTPIPTGTPIPTSTPRPILQPNFLADPQVSCFLHQDDYALSCLDRDGWHVYYPDAPIKYMRTIAQCPDGRIYIGGSDFVYRLEGDVLVDLEYDTKTLMKKIVCGPGNDIWVGRNEGVSHFDGSTWTHFLANEYLGSGEYVTLNVDIAIAPDGKVWVLTMQSIAAFDGDNWQVFEKGHGFNEFQDPKALGVDANGQVWVANNYDELLKYDGAQWSTVADLRCHGEIGCGSIYTMTFDAQGRIWVGTQGGILVFDPKTNSVVDRFGEGTLDGQRVIAMQFDHLNRLWVVTDYGIDIYDGSAWTAYHMHTADLFANTADQMIVFGDGPRLPALAQKAPGSVRGQLVNSEAAPYTNILVEICVTNVGVIYFGDTPCANQPYRVLIKVAANGEFAVADIPVGHYYLTFQRDEDTWDKGGEFDVHPGEETQLGEIDTTE